MNTKINIVMYHYVRPIKDSQYSRIKGLEFEDFQHQLDYLSSNYHIISPNDLIGALNHDIQLDNRSVLLTFDDGYIDHFKYVYPELMKRNIKGFFSMPGKILAEKKLLDVNKIHFILACADTHDIIQSLFDMLNDLRKEGHIIPANQDLYNKLALAGRYDTADIIFIKRLLQAELPEKLRNIMTSNLFAQHVGMSESDFCDQLYINMEHIKTMKNDGMVFGIHGYDHYWMNQLSKRDLEMDIDKALDVFDGIIDRNNWICCYPYGSVSASVITCIEKRGAVAGLTTVPDFAEISNDNRFTLQRFDTNDYPPISSRLIVQ